MTIDQPGLGKRMGQEARRISSQHRQLDTLYDMLAQALRTGDAGGIRTCFGRFADALDAHFSLEDSFYFPALHGMRPELEPALEALSRGHAAMRRELAALGELLDRDPAAAPERIDAFVAGLERHEREEEALLERTQSPP